ncbi:hypothetical protein HELRODRAFT_183289 [Helobdella robusta]|uniref:Uncharacterized protein n=1 Tax=Helobdella robusta TaxID=6412 RepID=T1FJF1_HELRO|nr:hypothetical protein HELRODRAFT_183289 [Helobdella robusta]ESO11345.1 hypothetical protein HELRODRAFT_183289 [Helobdella robusta]
MNSENLIDAMNEINVISAEVVDANVSSSNAAVVTKRESFNRKSINWLSQHFSYFLNELRENAIIILTFGDVNQSTSNVNNNNNINNININNININNNNINNNNNRLKNKTESVPTKNSRKNSRKKKEKESTYHQEVPTFNGLITSIEAFVFLTTSVFIILLTPFLSPNKDQKPTKIVLITLMVVAIGIIINFSVKRKKYLQAKDKPLGLRGQLVVIGIIIFFALGLFKDLSNVIVTVNCFSVYARCGQTATIIASLALAFHTLKIIYMALQTSFCIQFRNYRFLNRCSSQFGLMILNAANLGTWFDILLRQSASNLDKLIDLDYSNNCNVSFLNDSKSSFNDEVKPTGFLDYYFGVSNSSANVSHELNCVHINSSFHEFINFKVSPITFPFMFQFSLLVLECYVYWFAQCGLSGVVHQIDGVSGNRKSFIEKNSTEKFNEEKTVTEAAATTATEVATTTAATTTCQPSHPEHRFPSRIYHASSNDDLTASNNFTSDTFDSNSVKIETTPGLRGHKKILKQSFVLIIILNITFGMFNFAPLAVSIDEKELYDNLKDWYCFFYWLLSIILIFVGFYCSTAFGETDKKKKFQSLNYLLIISAFGPYVYSVSTIITALKLQALPPTQNLYVIIMKEIVFFLSVFIQIPFCFLAGKVVLPSRSLKKSFRVNCFMTLTLYFAISNGMLWIVDSFAIYNKDISDTQTNVLDPNKWAYFRNIIFPLSLSFRFNSCLLFIAAYLRMTSSLPGKIDMFFLE